MDESEQSAVNAITGHMAVAVVVVVIMFAAVASWAGYEYREHARAETALTNLRKWVTVLQGMALADQAEVTRLRELLERQGEQLRATEARQARPLPPVLMIDPRLDARAPVATQP